MTFGPTVVLALSRGDFSDMWHGISLHGDDGQDSVELRHVV